ncbi:uncharacterized protein LOC110974574 [Acanthaster planci]|uniref:Uncharacterized protein LOC110974574 n=1 Tax=Acanthaster planci TaxID=133434 RepID=A0A8B7XMH2_ACAPL|nr:uncharacterized protein LOC110974574 [Acanthaster planci]
MYIRSLVVLTFCFAVFGNHLAPLYEVVKPIPNRYLIKVKNTGRNALSYLVDDLLAENERSAQPYPGFGHIDIIDEMDGDYLKILLVELDYKSLNTVRRHPAVEFVEEEDGRAISSEDDFDFGQFDSLGIDTEEKRSQSKRLTEDDFPYNEKGFNGLDRINQRDNELDKNISFSGNGFGVNIYLLSTGVLQTHDDFDCRVRMAYDVMGKTGEDCAGTGTSIAGIAIGKSVGVARAAMVHSVRVHDCNSTETSARHVAGMQWVANNRAKPCVVLLTASINNGGKTIDAAAEALVDAGCVVVAKSAPLRDSHSEKRACSFSPGRSRRVITVSGTYRNNRKADWAGDGICVDIFAPGSTLMTTFPTNDGYYELANGPNFSAAFVAGVAAIHLGNKVDAANVKTRILNDATPCVVGNDLKGAPNRMLYVDPGPYY